MNQYPMEKADVPAAIPVKDEVPRTRRPYAAPRLTVFGSVAALTGGGATSPVENMVNMGNMFRA